MKRFVYADNAATTQVSPRGAGGYETLAAGTVRQSFQHLFHRPSGRTAVETAPAAGGAALDCEPNEVYFTSGGSEADNWALKGTAHLLAKQGKRHLITTNFEHHAILHTCAALEKEGFEVTYLPVDSKGLVTAEQVRQAIRPDTALVSIMYANNEIGTVQPISEIAAVCKEAGVRFHTDAVQAVGHLPISVREQNITMLSSVRP